MKVLLTNLNAAAVTSFLLALPFVYLFVHFMLGIEISHGPLDPLITAEGSRLGSFIVFGAAGLLLAGFFVSLVPIVQDVQAGNGLTAHPVNLLLAVIILFIFIMVVGAIIIDQYPCWISVPNCD